MIPEEFLAQWRAQSARVDELIRINQRLLLAQALRPVRASLRWSRAGDVFEAVLALPCLLGTGSFIGAHFFEARFLVPGLALHLWFIAVLVVAINRFVRKAAIQYDAPVLTLQRQIETLQAFTLRALRVTFVSALIVWGAPLWIVLARGLAGWDVYAWPGATVLLEVLGTTVALALLTVGICAYCAPRIERMPWLRRLARDLAGHNLRVAQKRLAQIARMEQGEGRGG
jgi:hypothetical protein